MGNTLLKPQEIEVEKQGQQQVEEVSSFTCEICVEPLLSARKFQNGGLCTHPFCLDCIAKYIEVKVEGTNYGYVECPGLNCSQQLDPLACKSIISKPIFEKWCDLLRDLTVLGSETCYCPYQDCSALILNECKDNLKKINCPNCKRNFCFSCKMPWHAGYRCDESGHLRDINDILIGQLIEEKQWTRCYNCGHSVERLQGCRHVKCICGVQFCHQCGEAIHAGACKNGQIHKDISWAYLTPLIIILLGCFFLLLYYEFRLMWSCC